MFPKENFSNYTIHTAKVVNPTDKVRIAALIRKDMKFKIRENIMDVNISTGSRVRQMTKSFHITSKSNCFCLKDYCEPKKTDLKSH